ncbi:alpha/beta hydrolase [Chryseomicrobium imtechense]
MTQFEVLKGAEAFTYEGGKKGVLVSHGFTGTTQSMKPLADAFVEAGYTVSMPRLKGHGTHHEEMETSTYQEWIDSIEEAYAWLSERCDTIYMTGLSMGGTLTLYMAQHHPDLKAISLINAAIEVPAMEGVKQLPAEVRFLDAIGSDIKKPGVVELAYGKTPVAAVKQLLTFMEEVKSGLSSVQCPTIIFVAPEDHVVPPTNSQTILDTIASRDKVLVELPESYHVATLDNDQETIIQKTLAFFEEQV